MRSTLIIDADDTLWENNIHFEEATERFLDIVESRGGEREPARDRLTQIEKRNIPIHGYGCGGYCRSLLDTLEEIEGKPASSSDRARILSLAQRVRRMPIQYLPGVKETLPLLRQRHRLILFTKGELDEQRDKVARSGVEAFFHEVEVTGEKKAEDYHRLVERHAIVRDESWMIGNSPRSDINPALDSGLGAVYIPHENTWTLEHEDVRSQEGARLKVLKHFSELLQHFFRE
ncbi:MAG: HAD family hydrolase [Acidobacteria bacterium]|nr:MAG: HAD family hydrolase [Acidobacteriota bacterium]